MTASVAHLPRQSGPPDADPLAQAQAAYDLLELAPEQAKAAAEAVINECEDHPAAGVLAMRTLGLAVRFLDGPNPAVVVLRDAVRLATKHDLPQSLAEAKMTHAALLADLGQINTALAECDDAAGLLRGSGSGRVLAQRAMILSRASRSEEALADYAKALPLLRANDEVNFLCRLFINRANLLAYLGRLNAAERDLRAGLEIAREHGLDDAATSMAERETPRSSGMLAGASDALRPLVRLDCITTRWRGFVPTEIAWSVNATAVRPTLLISGVTAHNGARYDLRPRLRSAGQRG